MVGVSYSAALALRLAADTPERAYSLVLLEPPPVHTRHAAEFRAANERLLRTRRERGATAALDEFLTMLMGSDWRDVADRHVAGASAQMTRDAVTFFDTDVPALLAWRFGPADVRAISCPVLHVGGTDSGPLFAAVRALILEWFPAPTTWSSTARTTPSH